MAIGSDFEIQSDKDIRYTGAAHAASGAGYYTVLELHRWLQDLADDASSSGDDLMDMAKDTPSEKAYDTIITLKNGFNIDQTAAEHLYGGSIIQGSGGTEAIWDGIEVFCNPGAHVEIQQNGAIIANDFWNTIPFGSSNKGLNPDSARGVSHRFMVSVRTSGADIDGRRLVLQTREFNYTYSEFKIPGTGRGQNAAALVYASDLNNQTAEGTVSGWTDVVNLTEGYVAIDANGDAVNEYYYSKWDRASRTMNQMYERLKWLTRRGSASTLYGLNGELLRGVTHEITTDTPTGTFNAVEGVTWSGGTGRMLAINSTTAPTKLWMQLLTGVAPTDNQTITGSTSGATCMVNVTVTERTLSQPFCGLSTGSALIGAYGLGVEAADLSASDRVTDLTNTVRTPPNQQTFTVNGLVSGEDAVLVGPASGGVLQTNQFTLNGALTGASVTSVVMNQTIPADTPASTSASGNQTYLRITRANGAITKHAFTAWSGSTFTINSTDFSTNNANNGAGAFISYIDVLADGTSEAVALLYASDRTLCIRVRDGGGTPIKPFETTATFTATGGSVTAIRTSDA